MNVDEPEFVSLARDVKEIRSALLGDAFTGRKGIIHFHDLLTQDVYGVGSDGRPIEGKSNTLLSRISALEDNQKKAIWIFSGLLLAFTAAKVGLTALIDRIFNK